MLTALSLAVVLAAVVPPGRSARSLAELPLAFEPNLGQSRGPWDFVARGAGYGIGLARDRVALRLRGEELSLRLLGARASPLEGEARLPSVSRYYLGKDPSRWLPEVPTFARVIERRVYAGIDLAWHGRGRRLEYDFTIRPGASPATIGLDLTGAAARIDHRGNLEVVTPSGKKLVEPPPVAFQAGHAVPVAWVLRGGRLGFRVGAHDRKRVLVIDPFIGYSSCLGGSSDDEARALAADPTGASYVTGLTESDDFPGTTPTGRPSGSFQNAFVAKVAPDGSSLVWATYLGGLSPNAFDTALGIAVDSSGASYVAGQTLSTDFPTPNGYQTALAGNSAAFLAKLSPAGELVYGTYFGTAGGDAMGAAVAVDGSGAAYLAGSAHPGIPTTQGVVQSGAPPPFCSRLSCTDGPFAFVAKLDPSASGAASLVWSTYVETAGSEAFGVAVDALGDAFVGGTTVSNDSGGFVLKLDPVASSYLYVSPSPGGGVAAVDVDPLGRATAAGTESMGPMASLALAFRVNALGTAFDWVQYLGTTGENEGSGVRLDPSGDAWVVGTTDSTSFPLAAPTQGSYGGGISNFVTEIDPTGGKLLFSTYLGGSGRDIAYGVATDASGNAYVAGTTESKDFPTVDPLQPECSESGPGDAFVTEFAPLSGRSIRLVLLPGLEVFPLPPGVVNSLVAKVGAAASSLDRGDESAAAGQLGALSRELQALVRGGRLTAAQVAPVQGQIGSVLSAFGN